MSWNGETDWRIRNANHKTVKQQRKDDMGNVATRIGVAVVAVLVVLAKNIPEDFFDIAMLIAFLPTIMMLLVAVFPFAAALAIYLILRRKRKRDAVEAQDAPRSYLQHERPADFDGGYAVNTNSVRDYSDIVDSWDIKDPKPPWEL